MAMIDDRDYLESFGIRSRSARAGEVWRDLVESSVAGDADFTSRWSSVIDTILREGPLARRIIRAVAGDEPSVAARLSLPRERLHDVYAELCDCLRENRTFHADA